MYNDLMLAPSGLSKLEREMIAVAVSSQNRCYYCLVAHGAAVRALSGDPALGELMVMNYRAARLSKRQRAMLDFAVKLTAEPWAIEEEDREALRKAGFTDRDIWDIAAVAGFFNMSQPRRRRPPTCGRTRSIMPRRAADPAAQQETSSRGKCVAMTNDTVRVESGLLAGARSADGTVCSFKGVPYAAAAGRAAALEATATAAALERHPARDGVRAAQHPAEPADACGGLLRAGTGERGLPHPEHLDCRAAHPTKSVR